MNSQNLYFEAPEQEEDALSFCDLPIHDDEFEEDLNEKQTVATSVSDQELDVFEFVTDPVHGYNPMEIVFCGKSIEPSKESKPINRSFSSRSESFKLGHCPSSLSPHHGDHHKSQLMKSKTCSGSNSRKQLIGLVKYHQQEMDLNEMRKRQGRRAPAVMFPATGEEKPAEGKGQSSSVMRPLRCRSHLLSALAKVALGCIPRV